MNTRVQHIGLTIIIRHFEFVHFGFLNFIVIILQ